MGFALLVRVCLVLPSPYANVATFSPPSGTPNLDTLDPGCGIPVNQYFWLNSLHPTYPMHDVVAEQVVAALEKGPNVF